MTDDAIGPPTPDFLTAYLAWCAGGTAPTVYHRWCGIALLSAAIQTRVQTAWSGDRSSTLALYVMLVGESGSGKGEAITRRALEAAGRQNTAINPFAGQISSAGLLAYMAGAFKGAIKDKSLWPRNWGHCWFIAEELASDMRTGDAARVALADLTGLWGKTFHATITVGRGYFVIPDLCLSVLVGTTETWLKKVFPPDAVESGTLARFLTITVPATETRPPRDPHTTSGDLTRYIKDWVTAYAHVAVHEPPVVLAWDDDAWDEKADAVATCAYAYHEEYFRPFMARTDELLSKLAGLATLSGWGFHYVPCGTGYVPTLDVPSDPRVSVSALRRAITWYKDALRGLPRVIKVLRATPWSMEVDQVLAVLKSAKGAWTYGRLIREAKGIYGMTDYGVKKALRALEASEEVGTTPGNPYMNIPPVYWARDDHDEVDP